MWDQSPIASGEFQTQIDWLLARLEEMKASDLGYSDRSIDDHGRLDAPDLPAYVIVTDESLVSGLLTTMVITFVGDLANPSLLVLVRFPESKLSQSALAKDVIVVSQIASCYQPEN
jgi:hypothetical protein